MRSLRNHAADPVAAAALRSPAVEPLAFHRRLPGYREGPQRVLEGGGYHVKGKNEPEHQALLADAEALAQAGAFAIVLELVTPRVAKELTQRLPLPTIGIGAGPDCDGQILVTPDLLGMLPWYNLKHVKPKLNAAEQMRAVVKEWKESVET